MLRLFSVGMTATAVFALSGALAPASGQQTNTRDTTASGKVHRLTPVTVTATRTIKTLFEAPQPVSVIGEMRIREFNPNTVTDLFRAQPGLDVTGVGTNQARPSIRGQRGQRILLLEDGMRLSNSRRQQDFGELPALVDVSSVQRVEVVRGPASVLYGSDAIGGVVNMITRTPEEPGLHGTAGYRYSSADKQSKGVVSLYGRYGQLSFLGGGSYRSTSAYDAPSGTYGEITLADRTSVNDTYVEDYSVDLYLGYDVAPEQRVFAKYERYSADTSGFGWVDPELYDPGSASIEIRYPFQHFDKFTLGYRGNGLGTALADRIDFAGYYQANERELTNDIFIPFGPGMGLDISSLNYTDIRTVGLRIEASKFAWNTVAFTYGADFFQDDTENTDFSVSDFVGMGPPAPDTSDVANVPNASYRNIGAFLQGDIGITSQLTLILGARYQNVNAKTKETPGYDELWSNSYNSFVGAANAIFQVNDNVSLIGTVGRAFRAPNIIESFFDGPTPEGLGYQSRNDSLKPEQSLNLDFGVRYRDRLFYVEGFVFRNQITDGIRIQETGDSVGPFFEVKNVNVDKLRYVGVELAGDVSLPVGISVGANYTYFDTKDVNDPQNPVGDSYSSKVAGNVRYTHPSDRFWVEYEIRRNGDRKDAFCSTDNPEECASVPAVGLVLPAFTVHNARAGVMLFQRGLHRHRIGLAVTNIGDALYAEFSNASFFRPEARRGVTLTYDLSF